MLTATSWTFLRRSAFSYYMLIVSFHTDYFNPRTYTQGDDEDVIEELLDLLELIHAAAVYDRSFKELGKIREGKRRSAPI